MGGVDSACCRNAPARVPKSACVGHRQHSVQSLQALDQVGVTITDFWLLFPPPLASACSRSCSLLQLLMRFRPPPLLAPPAAPPPCPQLSCGAPCLVPRTPRPREARRRRPPGGRRRRQSPGAPAGSAPRPRRHRRRRPRPPPPLAAGRRKAHSLPGGIAPAGRGARPWNDADGVCVLAQPCAAPCACRRGCSFCGLRERGL